MRMTPEQQAEIAALRESKSETRRPTVPALEEVLYEAIEVLDHGFIRVIDYMGNDAAIVQAARVSYGKGTKKVSEDRGLIRYLMRHRHTTPLEMCELKLHCKLPIFVARQWIRHRSACLAGDTRLAFERLGGLPITIEQLHRLWHDETSMSRRAELAQLRLRFCDEASGDIRHTRVVDVWETGSRLVLRVTLESGHELKMTKDHRCLTELGWLTLEEATRLRAVGNGGISWAADAPAFAIDSSEGRRQFARITRIEQAGYEKTYDLEVAGPWHNFVANGFIVHNSVNEYSARYSILDKEFYVPAVADLGVQATSNRQGRGDVLAPERAAQVLKILKDDAELTYAHYQDMLNLDDEGNPLRPDEPGLARELARMNLTLAYYTQWYWKIDLHNLLHFLSLRMDDHAQMEIRVYADAIAKVVERWVPHAWEAFRDYRLGGMHLSRAEIDVVKKMIKGEKADLDAAGLSKREQEELKKKLGL